MDCYAYMRFSSFCKYFGDYVSRYKCNVKLMTINVSCNVASNVYKAMCD